MEGVENGDDGTYGIRLAGNEKCGTDGKGAAGQAASDAYAEHRDGSPAQRSPVSIDQLAGIGSRTGIVFIIERVRDGMKQRELVKPDQGKDPEQFGYGWHC